MSFFEKMKLARENKDHVAFGELLSDNYTFVRLQTWTTMNKDETSNLHFNSVAIIIFSYITIMHIDSIIITLTIIHQLVLITILYRIKQHVNLHKFI